MKIQRSDRLLPSVEAQLWLEDDEICRKGLWWPELSWCHYAAAYALTAKLRLRFCSWNQWLSNHGGGGQIAGTATASIA